MTTLTNNDALRSIAATLQLDGPALVAIVKAGGGSVDVATVERLRKQDGDPVFLPCSHEVMAAFLNGLVITRRGQRPGDAPAPLEVPVTNNIIMKKVRIAFDLKDADLAALFARGGVVVSKSERSSWFRNAENKHHRPCSDEALQALLNGLTATSVDGAPT
jgi:uncharacterized protein YehS (DUF1456 family)